MSLVEQELLTLLVHRSSTSVFSGIRIARSLVLCIVFCRSLFVLSSFFFWPFYSFTFIQWFVGGLRSYLRYLCLLAYSGVQHILTIWVTWWLSYKRQELFALREHIGSPLVVDGVCVAHLFSFLCCVFCFVCLCPLSCVPNIVSLSGLFILDYHFGIL